MQTQNNDSLYQRIRQEIFKDNSKAKVSGDGKFIRNVQCPACGAPEARVHHDRPLAFICQRGNQCYAVTPVKEVYPELFKQLSEYYPPTPTDPDATATAYLRLRGIETQAGYVKYRQGRVFDKDTNRYYPSVEIRVDDDTTFHRLIDYTGKDKTRIFGSYSGKVWNPEPLDFSRSIWIVEGIIDGFSLIQSGTQTIATLSSAHLPKKFYESVKQYNPNFIIAFDSDTAGLRATDKHRKYFEDQGIKFAVALPPTGKDWNDLLHDGRIKPDIIDESTWRGRLHCAASAREYFSIYRERKKTDQLIFSYHNQMFNGWYTENTKEEHTKRLADCSIDILYSIENDTIEYQSKTKHRLRLCSKREGENIIEVSSEELSNPALFKTKLTHYRQLFFGSGLDLAHVTQHLFDKKSPKIRQCHAFGYDAKSDCFVLSKFLYDRTGKRFEISKDNYFEKQRLTPFQSKEKSMNHFAEIDLKQFLDTLHQAYSYRGLMALGFWVSSAYSHLIFDQLSYFPFVSMHGDPHCGKSDLTRLLNRCFFMDWEGINMTKVNTAKGELRKISQKSSLVVPLLEGRKDKARFDYDSVLAGYNRNPLQVRAQTTQGNETFELPFESTLAFVWNRELFEDKAAKERVISIHFKETDLSPESSGAWQRLMEYSPEQLAYVGHFVLHHRKQFEDLILPAINFAADWMMKEGVTMSRIAKNHAVLMAGVESFYNILKHPMPDGLPDYVSGIAKNKIETSRTETMLADYFFDAIDQLQSPTGKILRNDEIYIQMPTIMMELKEGLNMSFNESMLFDSLKQCDRFKEANKRFRLDKMQKRYWVFKA